LFFLQECFKNILGTVLQEGQGRYRLSFIALSFYKAASNYTAPLFMHTIVLLMLPAVLLMLKCTVYRAVHSVAAASR
jgi:hypothetical protein